MRVAFCEPYPMGLGGNFLTQRLILERLDRERIEPIVVAPVEGVALDRFRALGVECVVVSPPRGLRRYGGAVLQEGFAGQVKNGFDLLRYNLQLARFLRERKIELVYANCVRAQLTIGLGALLTRTPCLLYVKGRLANPIIDFLSFLTADRVLFMCQGTLARANPRLIRKFKRKISILDGGLDPREVERAIGGDKSTLKEELDITSANFNVGVVGQICRMKGQHVVVDALARLVAEFSNLRLYLVGDAVIDADKPYVEDLRTKVEAANLSRYVRFVGWRTDALEIVSCLDLLINPSFSEGFGYVPLEGMAVGLPVIATRVGVLPEAISHGIDGYLVEPGDDATVAQHWRELILNPELRTRMGREAQRKIFANYMINDKVTRLSEIWAEMAGGSA